MIAAVISLGFAVQPQAVEIVPAPTAPPTMVAIPQARIRCDVRRDDGTAAHFTLQRGGGMAKRYSGALMGIPLSAAIIDDPDNVMAGYELDAWGLDSVFGRARSGSVRPAFGDRFQILLDRADQDPGLDKRARVALRLEEHRAPDWGLRPYVRAVGFCDVIPKPSASLTRRDAKEPNQ